MTPTKKKPEQSDVIRTTILLPHALWAEAKGLAAVERMNLRDLILEGLRMAIKSRKGRS